jgi:sugar phosphate isomerase/epimerase
LVSQGSRLDAWSILLSINGRVLPAVKRVSTEASRRAREIAQAAANLARELGADQVVVMIGLPDEGHSAYGHHRFGACLPVRGLIETCREEIVESLWPETN